MRQRDTSSLAVVCSLPTVTTALRVKPARSQRRGKRGSGVPVVRGTPGRYVLDAVLGEAATQQEVYQALVAPLVDSFVAGANAVLLAYGAAASGKSHTLQGGAVTDSADDAGMILRAAYAVVRGLAVVPKAKYSLSVAYCGLSIGHEAQLTDLLAPASGAAPVSLRDGSAAAALAGLTHWAVEDPCDITEALRCRRLLFSAGGGSRGGSGSKRSLHTMLTLSLDSFDADGVRLHRNTLSFVELAAPEPKDRLSLNRSSGTDSANARSLAVAYQSLGKVLSALRNTAASSSSGNLQASGGSATAQQQLLQHVPWRDSPLTRWLQEQLDGAHVLTMLGTIGMEPEAAAESLATISWVSRFSAAGRSSADGVVVSFAWDALADPENQAGHFIRFQPDPASQAAQQQAQHQQAQQRRPASPSRQQAACATAHGSCLQGPSALCNVGSPNLNYVPVSAASPHDCRPRSAGSVCQVGRWPGGEQAPQPRALSPLRRSISTHPYHQQQQQQQQHGQEAASIPWPQHQHHVLQADAGGGLGESGESRPAADADAHAADGAPEQQQQQQQQDKADAAAAAAVEDEVLLYGELMTAVRRGGGGLRAEAILEQLLQELGAARAGLSAERGEARVLRSRLQEVEGQHVGCEPSRRLLQEQAQEAAQQLEVVRKSLAEVSADRDLFLKRLQQLELEGEPGGSSGVFELQRQKAHAAQLHMLEAELNSLASSNQQLRGQLEAAGQQLAAASRERLAAQEAAAEAASKAAQHAAALQAEVDVLRSTAEVEAAVRLEMEATNGELQLACDAAAMQLATLEQQAASAHESIDALAAELQDTLGHLEVQQQAAAQLAQQLAAAQQERDAAQQQLGAAQAQAEELAASAQQLQQRLAEEAALRADLCCVLSDFELDMASSLPQHYGTLLQGATDADAAAPSPHGTKLRGKLLSLLRSSAGPSSSGGSRPGSPHTAAAAGNAGAALPSLWAGKLSAVIEVLELAGAERQAVAEELASAQQRVALQESNIEELRKLVATQESLQQQLAAQLDDANSRADDGQAALAAMVTDLQAAVSDRDTALDVLADELVAVSGLCDQASADKLKAEAQAASLSAELEDAILQLCGRERCLQEVWGLLQCTPAAAAAAAAAAAPHEPAAAAGSSPAASSALAESRAGQIEKLRQQQARWGSQQQQQPQQQQQVVRRLSGGADTAGVAGLAQRAISAALRRSSQGSEEAAAAANGGKQGRLQHHHQRQQETAAAASARRQGAQPDQEQVQMMVVSTVQQLTQQASSLQQQLAEAQASAAESGARLQQQLQHKLQAQGDAQALSQQLLSKEQELHQAQMNCLEIDAALQQLKQQQQQPGPASLNDTQVARLLEVELQLVDARKQLAAAKSAAEEAAASLAAERTARLAAEDRDASRQGLLQRLAALQDEVQGLHAALLAERRSVVQLQQELGLMATSRNTWRDAAKRAEASVADAKAAAEGRSTDLTRARAEVLQLRQELVTSTQQLALTAGCSEPGLAARLAAAQAAKHQSDDRAAELARKLAEAQAQLAALQQAAGDSQAETASQLWAAQAQLARARADAAGLRAAAATAASAPAGSGSRGGSTAASEVPAASVLSGGGTTPQRSQLQALVHKQQLLEAAQAEYDALRAQLHTGELACSFKELLSSTSVVSAAPTLAPGAAAAALQRRRSLSEQLQAAEKLVLDMRATASAAAALSESSGRVSYSSVPCSDGDSPVLQQQQQQASGGGNRSSCPSLLGASGAAPGSEVPAAAQQPAGSSTAAAPTRTSSPTNARSPGRLAAHAHRPPQQLVGAVEDDSSRSGSPTSKGGLLARMFGGRHDGAGSSGGSPLVGDRLLAGASSPRANAQERAAAAALRASVAAPCLY